MKKKFFQLYKLGEFDGLISILFILIFKGVTNIAYYVALIMAVIIWHISKNNVFGDKGERKLLLLAVRKY